MAEELSADELAAREKSISDVQRIIAAINPDMYSENAQEIKKLINEEKFWQAVKITKPGVPKSSRYTQRNLGRQFKISYNCSYETLEPVYFWILDFLGNLGDTEKLIDNFVSSPTSGHFAEQMGRATRMQEEAMKIMQTIGVLIKSILNIIYDLRQFKQRLKDYQDAKSKDKDKKIAAIYSLKQIWMDNVDIKRGNTSIKALAFSQAAFSTLIDAFMTAEKIKNGKVIGYNGKEIDLNERVIRIIEQRLQEFLTWKDLSENEIRKRYNIEKAYLRSQVDSMKLYSRWAQPYLKAAEELRMMETSNAALVKAFNTVLLKLTLLTTRSIDVAQETLGSAPNLPKGFEKLAKRKKIRPTYACILTEFSFRGIPARTEQHYTFGGKVDISFTAFALNKDEIDMLKKKLSESDFRDALKLISGMTDESLKEIEKDIDEFLSEKEIEEEKEEKEKEITPFTALIGVGGKKKKEKERKEKEKKIKPDNYAESVVRQYAELVARKNCFTVYDIYKKAHGMGSIPFDKLFEKQ